MRLFRRLFYLVLATVTIALSFYVLELLLIDVGVMQLLGIREHGFLGAGVMISLLGSLMTWYLARDLVISSTMTHLVTGGEWPDVVADLARRSGLKWVPEVGVYEYAGSNAIVVGRVNSRMLIALSQGLIDAGPGPAANLVIAHQLARIQSGDVVTQLLLQGFVSIFTLFPTRMFATFLGTSLRTAEDETPTDSPEALLASLLEMLITPYTSLLVRFYARGVEARCDLRACEVLGQAQVITGFAELTQAPTQQPYRELFALPLKFSGKPMAATNLLVYHASLPQRLVSLTRQQNATFRAKTGQ